jgi:hypothetical protein
MATYLVHCVAKYLIMTMDGQKRIRYTSYEEYQLEDQGNLHVTGWSLIFTVMTGM